MMGKCKVSKIKWEKLWSFIWSILIYSNKLGSRITPKQLDGVLKGQPNMVASVHYLDLGDLLERHLPHETNFSRVCGLLARIFKRESCTLWTLNKYADSGNRLYDFSCDIINAKDFNCDIIN